MSQYQRGMNGWEQHFKCAKTYFSQGKHLSAYEHFQDAATLAYQLFCEYPTKKNVIKALLDSHRNLANLHVRERALDLAYQELVTVSNHIEDALERYQSSKSELPEPLLWGKNCTLKELLLFEQTYCH